MGQCLYMDENEISSKGTSFLAIDIIRDIIKMSEENKELSKMITKKENIYTITRLGVANLCMYVDSAINGAWIEDKVQNSEYWAWKSYMTISKEEYDKQTNLNIREDVQFIYRFFTRILYEMILNNKRTIKAYLE